MDSEKPALDSAATTPQIVETHQLKPWSQISARDIQDLERLAKDEKIHDKSPFPYSREINGKVALWFGDITQLGVTAIVNSTNEHFNEVWIR